jgi:hypothetical protein
MLSALWEEVNMYTVLITQEVHCSDKARVLELWAGNDFKGEAIDIKVFKDEEQWDDKDIQTELNRARECVRTHLQGFKEVFAP